MVVNASPLEAEKFFKDFSAQFERIHSSALSELQTVKLPQHVLENELAKLYRSTKYKIPLNDAIFYSLITFLGSESKLGGKTIIFLLQTYCNVITTPRGPTNPYSFEAIANYSKMKPEDKVDLEEGIPGAFTGVTHQDIMHNNTVLKLGKMPMESGLMEDVRASLLSEDVANPPPIGKKSYVEEFDHRIKTEHDPTNAPASEIPLPPSRARDVVMEVQKTKEYRDRFTIESRSGGIGPGVSVIMYTFHNTLDGYGNLSP